MNFKIQSKELNTLETVLINLIVEYQLDIESAKNNAIKYLSASNFNKAHELLCN